MVCVPFRRYRAVIFEGSNHSLNYLLLLYDTTVFITGSDPHHNVQFNKEYPHSLRCHSNKRFRWKPTKMRGGHQASRLQRERATIASNKDNKLESPRSTSSFHHSILERTNKQPISNSIVQQLIGIMSTSETAQEVSSQGNIQIITVTKTN